MLMLALVGNSVHKLYFDLRKPDSNRLYVLLSTLQSPVPWVPTTARKANPVYYVQWELTKVNPDNCIALIVLR